MFGCSNYTFAEATWSQQLSDWLGSHVRMLEYFGGVPAAIVPDNLKCAVHRALRYEPELNPSYEDSFWRRQTTVWSLPLRIVCRIFRHATPPDLLMTEHTPIRLVS